jgi:hypothetical protein
MPLKTLIEVEQTGTCAHDPDPALSIGEAHDVAGVYQYTWLRIGSVKLVFKERKRARRTLNHLHDALSKALLRLAEEAPLDGGPDDFPYEADEIDDNDDADE